MGVEVRQVARPLAHPGLAQRQHLGPVEIVALAAEEDAVDIVRVVIGRGLLFAEGDDEVAGDPVRALVGLVLVGDAGVAAGAAVDLEADDGGLRLDALAAAGRADVVDGLAAAAAGVAAHLHLLEHAWGELLLDDADAVAVAGGAVIDMLVLGAGALARLADVLLLPAELCGGAVVEVAEGDFDPDLDVLATGLASGGAKVAVAAEEAREHVKGVVAAAAARAAVLHAVVAVAVVDLSRLGVAQDIVGFGDLDELVFGGFIAAGDVLAGSGGVIGGAMGDVRVLVGVELFGQLAVRCL